MARRRNREAGLPRFIGALVVGLAAGWMLLPPFRSLVVAVAVLGVVVGAMWLIWQILKWVVSMQNLEPGLSNPVATPSLAPRLEFNQELLSDLEWRRFEILVALYFQKKGFTAKGTRTGADGGVDIEVYRQGEECPFAVVQCKAWNTYKVGVKPVRELYGVMAAQNVSTGYFVTSGDFTSEAWQFAEGKSLTLVSGSYLLEKLRELPSDAQTAILDEVTEGDYTTPTCPRCDAKMVAREGPNGPFWGCRSFPRCRQTFKMNDLNND